MENGYTARALHDAEAVSMAGKKYFLYFLMSRDSSGTRAI
jgi:hypothetical protein